MHRAISIATRMGQPTIASFFGYVVQQGIKTVIAQHGGIQGTHLERFFQMLFEEARQFLIGCLGR